MRSKSLRRGRGGSQSRITEIGDESCRSSRMGGLGGSWDQVVLFNHWENFRRLEDVVAFAGREDC